MFGWFSKREDPTLDAMFDLAATLLSTANRLALMRFDVNGKSVWYDNKGDIARDHKDSIELVTMMAAVSKVHGLEYEPSSKMSRYLSSGFPDPNINAKHLMAIGAALRNLTSPEERLLYMFDFIRPSNTGDFSPRVLKTLVNGAIKRL